MDIIKAELETLLGIMIQGDDLTALVYELVKDSKTIVQEKEVKEEKGNLPTFEEWIAQFKKGKGVKC